MTVQTGPTVEHRIDATGELAIEIAAGSLEVHGASGDTAVIRDVDGRDLAERFTIEAGAGSLRLREKDGLLGIRLGRRGEVNLRVEVPRSARVSLETASGDIRVEGLTGEQRYRTASGTVTVRRGSGKVRVDTVSGDASLGLDADTELEARLVSGDVSVTGGRLTTFVLQTTSGDIGVESSLPGAGPYSIKTVSGDTRILTADDLRVDFATVTGSVSAGRPHQRGPERGRSTIEVGESGSPMTFQSISGDLTIDQPGRASSTGPTDRRPQPVNGVPVRRGEDTASEARLAILRDLEAGRIDVSEATARLALLEGSD